MADRLSFQLELTGEMANALRGVVSQLNSADASMAKLRAGSTALDKELGKLKGSATPALAIEYGNLVNSFAGLRREASGQWVFNVAEGIKAIGGAAMTAGRFVADLAMKMALAVGRAEDLDLAERFNLGAAGSATARSIGDSFGNTRFDDDAVRRGILPLERAGIRDRALLDNLATAAADVEALTAGETKMGDALAALGKVATKRDFSERQLEALGINANDAFANLGGLLHKSADEAKKLAGAGKVSGETLLSVILDELAKKQGGVIGQASLEAGKTFGGTLQKLADLPENLLKLGKGSEGLKSLQQSIETIIGLLQGEEGAQLISGFAFALEGLIDIGVGVGLAFKYTGEAIGWLAAQVVLGSVALYDWITELPGRLWDGAKSIGTSIMNGITEGITAGLDAVAGAIGDVADSTIRWFREKLRIHSPSQVFADAGEEITAGAALGINRGAGKVTDAMRGLLTDGMSSGAAGRTASAADGGSQAAAPQFIFQIHGTNAREIGDEIEQRVEALLARHYDRAAFTVGAAA